MKGFKRREKQIDTNGRTHIYAATAWLASFLLAQQSKTRQKPTTAIAVITRIRLWPSRSSQGAAMSTSAPRRCADLSLINKKQGSNRMVGEGGGKTVFFFFFFFLNSADVDEDLHVSIQAQECCYSCYDTTWYFLCSKIQTSTLSITLLIMPNGRPKDTFSLGQMVDQKESSKYAKWHW